MSFTGMSASAKEDMVVSLATLVLHDGGKEITAENINAVIGATGNTVASYWGGLFQSLLAGKDVDDLIIKPVAGGPAAGGAAAAAGGEDAPAEDKKPSSSSSSAGGAAADLFGGSDSDSDDSSS